MGMCFGTSPVTIYRAFVKQRIQPASPNQRVNYYHPIFQALRVEIAPGKWYDELQRSDVLGRWLTLDDAVRRCSGQRIEGLQKGERYVSV